MGKLTKKGRKEEGREGGKEGDTDGLLFILQTPPSKSPPFPSCPVSVSHSAFFGYSGFHLSVRHLMPCTPLNYEFRCPPPGFGPITRVGTTIQSTSTQTSGPHCDPVGSFEQTSPGSESICLSCSLGLRVLKTFPTVPLQPVGENHGLDPNPMNSWMNSAFNNMLQF